jgi:hypothetical protein
VSDWPGGAIILGAGAVLFSWLLFDGLRTGRQVLGFAVWADRDRNPLGFWVLALVIAALAAECAVAAAGISLQRI